MSNEIAKLQPEIVWSYFDQITQVPRPSKHEEKIQKFLLDFAAAHSLECVQDDKGNIVISRAATAGFENVPAIVLQSHMDMVCEKDSSLAHDFMVDPIHTYIDNGWVRARGTTLGADCGIGMAMAMAALTSSEVQGPRLEALFTVDEEQGLTGAMGLGEGLLTGRRMINLDSEDDGEIFIGCAGGVDTLATFDVKTKKAPRKGFRYYKIEVSGLNGGHSGDDINRGYANAIKLVNRILWQVMADNGDVLLSQIDGGNLRNAIPREATSVIGVVQGQSAAVVALIEQMALELKAEFAATEPEMQIVIHALPEGHLVEAGGERRRVLEEVSAHILVAALAAVPHGPQAMSRTMPGLVETSTNLASVHFTSRDRVEVVTSQRSSVESAKADIAATVRSVFMLADAHVRHTDGYPGWTPNPDSQFVRQATELYQSLFGIEPKVKAIHAGLECGLIIAKYPNLDVISVGPTLRGAHSPSERIEIDTVDRQWKYLLELLKLEQ